MRYTTSNDSNREFSITKGASVVTNLSPTQSKPSLFFSSDFLKTPSFFTYPQQRTSFFLHHFPQTDPNPRALGIRNPKTTFSSVFEKRKRKLYTHLESGPETPGNQKTWRAYLQTSIYAHTHTRICIYFYSRMHDARMRLHARRKPNNNRRPATRARTCDTAAAAAAAAAPLPRFARTESRNIKGPVSKHACVWYRLRLLLTSFSRDLPGFCALMKLLLFTPALATLSGFRRITIVARKEGDARARGKGIREGKEKYSKERIWLVVFAGSFNWLF